AERVEQHQVQHRHPRRRAQGEDTDQHTEEQRQPQPWAEIARKRRRDRRDDQAGTEQITDALKQQQLLPRPRKRGVIRTIVHGPLLGGSLIGGSPPAAQTGSTDASPPALQYSGY